MGKGKTNLIKVNMISRDRGSEGRESEFTPVEFPWGNPIQLGREVGSQKLEDGGHPGEISCAVTSSISLGKEVRDQRSE